MTKHRFRRVAYQSLEFGAEIWVETLGKNLGKSEKQQEDNSQV